MILIAYLYDHWRQPMRTSHQMWSGSWLKNWRILMTHLRKGSKLVLMMMTSPLFLLILRAQVRYWQWFAPVIFFGPFMVNFSSTYADHAFVLALHEALVFFFSVNGISAHCLFWAKYLKLAHLTVHMTELKSALKFLSSFYLALLYIFWSENVNCKTVQLELHMRMEYSGWSCYYLVTSLILLQKVKLLSRD